MQHLTLLDLLLAADSDQHLVGIPWLVLDWFLSYLSRKSFTVLIGNFYFRMWGSTWSCSWPIAFSIWILPLGHFIKRHITDYHTRGQALIGGIRIRSEWVKQPLHVHEIFCQVSALAWPARQDEGSTLSSYKSLLKTCYSCCFLTNKV